MTLSLCPCGFDCPCGSGCACPHLTNSVNHPAWSELLRQTSETSRNIEAKADESHRRSYPSTETVPPVPQDPRRYSVDRRRYSAKRQDSRHGKFLFSAQERVRRRLVLPYSAHAVIDDYRHRSAEDRALEQMGQRSHHRNVAGRGHTEHRLPMHQQVLPAIKPQYSEIIRGVDLAENTLETFAKSAGITPGNATVRVHRARQAPKAARAHLRNLCRASLRRLHLRLELSASPFLKIRDIYHPSTSTGNSLGP